MQLRMQSRVHAHPPAWSHAANRFNLGGLWLKAHGLSVGSEVLGLSSRVRRAAPSLQMQPEERVVASCGTAQAAALSMLAHASQELARRYVILRRAVVDYEEDLGQ